MAMMPHARAQISHPAWCRSLHLDDPTDPVHDGPDTVLRCSDDDFQIALRLNRIDEHPIGGEQRVNATGVVLWATSLTMENEQGRPLGVDPFLTVADARKLAELLNAFADAAELPGTEVAW